VPHVLEAVDEGDKTLVFSQFTSLLAILKGELDRVGVRYEYLDGTTRDREGPVTRFQTDPDCRLFLISLKAGGVGLNLTAAEYVFLLDPWWNPAVEAQAIDRTHRIGQSRHVFAYRLIAKTRSKSACCSSSSRSVRWRTQSSPLTRACCERSDAKIWSSCCGLHYDSGAGNCDSPIRY
jgi:hypothetical protein